MLDCAATAPVQIITVNKRSHTVGSEIFILSSEKCLETASLKDLDRISVHFCVCDVTNPHLQAFPTATPIWTLLFGCFNFVVCLERLIMTNETDTTCFYSAPERSVREEPY